MPRPLVELQAPSPDRERTGRDHALTRRTARSLAAAMSVLLVATLVVNRTNHALDTVDAGASSVVSSGTIELSDDDQGRALFDLQDLTPTRAEERCIEVVYGGSILPVGLAVRSESAGPLAAFLDVTIAEGDHAGFDSCDGFVDHGTVFDGTAAELATAGWIPLGDLVNSGDARSYRIRLGLQDRQEALGLTSTIEFAWEVTPS